MTITNRVHQAFFQQVPNDPASPQQNANLSPGLDPSPSQLIRIPQTKRQCKVTIAYNGGHHFTIVSSSDMLNASGHNQTWTPAEHERFLEALEFYPRGPWKCIAEFVGTKTARQAMSHAQKYRQKIARRQRGLQLPHGRRLKVRPTPSQQVQVVSKSATTTLQLHQHEIRHELPRQSLSPTPWSSQPATEIISAAPCHNEMHGSSGTMVSNQMNWTPMPNGQLLMQGDALSSVHAQQGSLCQCSPIQHTSHLALAELLGQSDQDSMVDCIVEQENAFDQQMLECAHNEEANLLFFGAWLENSSLSESHQDKYL